MKLARWQAGVLMLAVLLSCVWFGYRTGWRPPQNPDPNKILKEAESDTAAGRYTDALAKHVWYHENALKYISAAVVGPGDDKQTVELKSQLKEYAEQKFSSDAAILVALLALNQRTSEANWVVAEAEKWLSKPQLKMELEEAKKGQFPPQCE
ncbi:MAG: hypothetical protein WDM76_14140 [Limisphaerales bacterium]